MRSAAPNSEQARSEQLCFVAIAHKASRRAWTAVVVGPATSWSDHSLPVRNSRRDARLVGEPDMHIVDRRKDDAPIGRSGLHAGRTLQRGQHVRAVALPTGKRIELPGHDRILSLVCMPGALSVRPGSRWHMQP